MTTPGCIVLRVALTCALAPVAAHAAAQHVRDSAGTRLISYGDRDVPKGRWALDPTPTVEVGRGAEDGPYAFSEIAGIVRLSDGRIAVANQRPSEIRIFDSHGRYDRSLGRNGEGPGEFNRVLWRLLRSGDTLIGIDNSGRAQIFGTSGDLLRSLPRARPPGTTGNPQRVAFDATGSAILHAAELNEPNAAPDAQVFMRVSRESPDAEHYVDILRIPWYRPIVARGPAPPFEVFGAGVKIAASARRICVGNTNVFAVTCYGHRAQPLVGIRRVIQTRAISQEDRDFFRTSYLAGNKGATPKVIAMIEESNRLTQFARRAPAFGRLLLAASGELWVSEFDRTEHVIGPPPFRRPQKPLRWSVLAADGTWLSDITTPARFLPYEIGADYIIGTTLGDDDVEHVTMYRIRR